MHPSAPKRRLSRVLVGSLLLVLAATSIAQPSYPTRPIRFVSGYAPGGTTTVVARLVGNKLTESLGQQVLVDNRPGGGTMIGTDIVAKATPDGHTIFLAGPSLVLVPLVYKAPYDPIKDLTPVATIAATEFVLLVNNSIPAGNLKEFVAYAKGRAQPLHYGTPGAGGLQHLAHELLNMMGGFSSQHIPYKGAVPAITDLLGGQVQMFFSSATMAIPQVLAGKVKGLAITGERRLPALPNVPTFEEAGMSGFFRIGGHFGIVAPARTPKAIIDRLAGEMAKFNAQPDFIEIMNNQGLLPYTAGPEKYAQILQTSYAENAALLKKMNFRLEQ